MAMSTLLGALVAVLLGGSVALGDSEEEKNTYRQNNAT